MDATLPVKFVDISVADHRLRGRLRRTPMQEAHLGLAHGMKLLQAREHGSLKERGTLNALMNLMGEQKKKRRHRRECGESRAAGAPHLDQDRQMQGAPSGHIGEAKTHAHKIMETGGQTYIIAGLHYAWSRN